MKLVIKYWILEQAINKEIKEFNILYHFKLVKNDFETVYDKTCSKATIPLIFDSF